MGPAIQGQREGKGGGDQRSDHPSQRVTPDQPTLSNMGVSRNQSSRWQGLAEIDDKTFDSAVSPSDVPTLEEMHAIA